MTTSRDFQFRWSVEIPNEGNKVTVKFAAYKWENGYRICVYLPKQKVYFELKDLDEIDIEKATAYFIANRLEFDHAKCFRCGTWRVETGLYCNRCDEAIKEGAISEATVEYEIQEDGKKVKL